MQPESQNTQGGWSFRREEAQADNQQGPTAPQKQIEPISWTGSEFIARHKGTGWYAGLAVLIIALCSLIFITTKDYISIVFVAVVGTLFAIIAGKHPRQLSYMIDGKGISIGDKFFPYDGFKSFALMRDGAIGYINLLPLKRFSPELSIYFAPEDEQRIFDALAASLPHEQRSEQTVDRMMRHLGF